MEELDGVHRQAEPLFLAVVGRFQVIIGLDDAVAGEFQVEVGAFQVGVGPRLHGEDGAGASEGDQHRGREGGDAGSILTCPSPGPARGAHARRRPARRPSSARCRRPTRGWSHNDPRGRASSPSCRPPREPGRWRVALPWPGKFAPLDLAEHLADIVAVTRRLPGQQAVKRRAKA